MTVAAAADVLPRRMAGWAGRRSLAPNALTGIGLACSLCAAAWFTSGSRLDAVAGGLVLCAGYLAHRIRVRLVAAAGAGGGAVAGAALPMLASWEGWLDGTVAAVGELTVYAGLAVGARASQQHGIWLLATGAAIMLSLRQVLRLCQPARSQPARSQPARSQAARSQHARPAAEFPSWPVLSLLIGRFLALSTGERTVVIVATAPFWGARVTFGVLIAWGAAVAGWAVVRSAWTSGGRPAGWIVACRDDGPAARLAGRLVQGQLVPLPPALAGLAAIALLATLGLGNLTGVLALAPVAAMLLAAPGAGHPHDGRLDWLVPLILLSGQYIFLVALGLSAGVPGPVMFAMISLVALRQLDVAIRASRPAGWPPQPSRLGWEGRIVLVGLAAVLTFVTFAYLALTAYLGWLMCRASVSGWLASREPAISEGARR